MSTCLMVLRRWATMRVVMLPPISLSRALCTTRSEVLSSADVASSCGAKSHGGGGGA